MSNRKWHAAAWTWLIFFMSLSVLLVIFMLIPEIYPSFKYYSLDYITKLLLGILAIILAIVSFFLFLIFLISIGPKRRQTEDLLENPTQSTRSRPRIAPISYLRTLSLPTYEMAMEKINWKKDEETPPPQFHELQFPSIQTQQLPWLSHICGVHSVMNKKNIVFPIPLLISTLLRYDANTVPAPSLFAIYIVLSPFFWWNFISKMD